jgi:putative spermidine/putrescine transport system permease protein
VAATTEGDQRPAGMRRRVSAFLFRYPYLKLGVLLGVPGAWFGVIYLGTLVLLFATAFWHLDPFTGLVVKEFSLQNFQQIVHDPVYKTIIIRTVGIAAAVALTDVILAFPVAYYAARLASPRVRNAVLIAVVLPLWANYLVRIFAWRLILSPGGLLVWVSDEVGLHLDLGYSNVSVWITFSYLWLPYVLLPMYAALERVPGSLLEASSDLGGRGWRTFRSVVFPLIVPGIVAGSIFAFSLTLGDYIVVQLVGNSRFIGNVIYDNVGIASNVPFAAAFALVPVAIISIYLLIAWRMGAFEAL